MSQASTKETNPPSKKAYHSPQLKKFGNVSELTLTTNTFTGSDGGSFPNQYAS